MTSTTTTTNSNKSSKRQGDSLTKDEYEARNNNNSNDRDDPNNDTDTAAHHAQPFARASSQVMAQRKILRVSGGSGRGRGSATSGGSGSGATSGGTQSGDLVRGPPISATAVAAPPMTSTINATAATTTSNPFAQVSLQTNASNSNPFAQVSLLQTTTTPANPAAAEPTTTTTTTATMTPFAATAAAAVPTATKKPRVFGAAAPFAAFGSHGVWAAASAVASGTHASSNTGSISSSSSSGGGFFASASNSSTNTTTTVQPLPTFGSSSSPSWAGVPPVDKSQPPQQHQNGAETPSTSPLAVSGTPPTTTPTTNSVASVEATASTKAAVDASENNQNENQPQQHESLTTTAAASAGCLPQEYTLQSGEENELCVLEVRARTWRRGPAAAPAESSAAVGTVLPSASSSSVPPSANLSVSSAAASEANETNGTVDAPAVIKTTSKGTTVVGAAAADTMQWHEVGLGPVRILRQTNTTTVTTTGNVNNMPAMRVVQRRESTPNGPATTVSMNVRLTPNSSTLSMPTERHVQLITIVAAAATPSSISHATTTDAPFAAAAVPETFLFKLASPTEASNFKRCLEKGIRPLE